MDSDEQLEFCRVRTKRLAHQAEVARFEMERLAAYIGRNGTIDKMVLAIQTHHRRVQEGLFEMDQVLQGKTPVTETSAKAAAAGTKGEKR